MTSRAGDCLSDDGLSDDVSDDVSNDVTLMTSRMAIDQVSDGDWVSLEAMQVRSASSCGCSTRRL
jgi:hypothetical protein